ncbi:BQ2448_53 [Microbotryum intermedium]|uniref:BQ2448_53 protein n=1 Tax=Microbotryum intermedium TaxID=269621 RepID=A0A238F1B6_9BASI|nr:BQ2448_53 [Microbotryum intermedium]
MSSPTTLYALLTPSQAAQTYLSGVTSSSLQPPLERLWTKHGLLSRLGRTTDAERVEAWVIVALPLLQGMQDKVRKQEGEGEYGIVEAFEWLACAVVWRAIGWDAGTGEWDLGELEE